MDSKVVILLITMLFAIIVSLLVAQGQLDISTIYMRVVKQNAETSIPQYEIVQPASHSYWNFYWNGDYYWTYVVIKSSEELKGTAPIKTSFPLREAPIIVQQGQDEDGWYYYRVVLKTDKLNEVAETFEVDGRKPQAVTVYPEVVDVSGKAEVEIASVVIKDQTVLPAQVLPALGAFTMPLLSYLSKAMAVYVQNEGDNFEYKDVTVTIDGQEEKVLGVYVNGKELKVGDTIYSGDIVGVVVDIDGQSAEQFDGKDIVVEFNSGQLKDEKKIKVAVASSVNQLVCDTSMKEAVIDVSMIRSSNSYNRYYVEQYGFVTHVWSGMVSDTFEIQYYTLIKRFCTSTKIYNIKTTSSLAKTSFKVYDIYEYNNNIISVTNTDYGVYVIKTSSDGTVEKAIKIAGTLRDAVSYNNYLYIATSVNENTPEYDDISTYIVRIDMNTLNVDKTVHITIYGNSVQNVKLFTKDNNIYMFISSSGVYTSVFNDLYIFDTDLNVIDGYHTNIDYKASAIAQSENYIAFTAYGVYVIDIDNHKIYKLDTPSQYWISIQNNELYIRTSSSDITVIDLTKLETNDYVVDAYSVSLATTNVQYINSFAIDAHVLKEEIDTNTIKLYIYDRSVNIKDTSEFITYTPTTLPTINIDRNSYTIQEYSASDLQSIIVPETLTVEDVTSTIAQEFTILGITEI